MDLRTNLTESMEQLNSENVLKYTKAMIEADHSFNSIQMCLNTGVAKVGTLFENGEYFIADLIISGMIYRDALNLITPLLSWTSPLPIGRVVIGVVEGDIHDIGKDIVVSVLRAERIEVIDLGIDVKPERFAYAVKTYLPDVLLLSGVIGLAKDSMEKTMNFLEAEGLRRDVPVLVGGCCASEYLMKHIGANGWANDTLVTVDFCKKVIGAKNAEK